MSEGKRLMSLREYNEAIRCFDEAIRFKPYDSVAYHLKGLCLEYLKNYGEAIKCFDDALKVKSFTFTYKTKKKIYKAA